MHAKREKRTFSGSHCAHRRQSWMSHCSLPFSSGRVKSQLPGKGWRSTELREMPVCSDAPLSACRWPEQCDRRGPWRRGQRCRREHRVHRHAKLAMLFSGRRLGGSCGSIPMLVRGDRSDAVGVRRLRRARGTQQQDAKHGEPASPARQHHGMIGGWRLAPGIPIGERRHDLSRRRTRRGAGRRDHSAIREASSAPALQP